MTIGTAGLNGASAALDALNGAIGAAAEHSHGIFQAGIEAWLAQTRRFQEEMFAQGSSTLQHLRVCRSPMDALAAEQAWLSARSKANLDAGPRFAKAFATVAQRLRPTLEAAAAVSTAPAE